MEYLTGQKHDEWLREAFSRNRNASKHDPHVGKSKREHSVGLAKRSLSFSTAAGDYYVESLPGIGALASHRTHPLTIHSGNLPSYPGEGHDGTDGDTGKDAQIFFMMVNARRSAGNDRVIFWFNGGPGCSSFDGSLMEVGPFRTIPAAQTESGEVELKLVEGGWEEFATIVFVDQPPGTGYSTVPTNHYLHELSQGSAHFVRFLQNFYSIFPEMKSKDTYLAGESFAGQYIPYFADTLLKSSDFPSFPLKGIAIGNGWIDPKTQYQGYVDFAYEKGLIKQGSKESETLEQYMQQCQIQLDKYTDPANLPVNVDLCGQVMGAVTDPFTQDLNGKKVCMNVYDTRLVDEWPACGMNWPPDLPDIYQYLRRKDVITALHANEKETAWVECDNIVSSQLYLQNSPASVHLLPGILERGVQVMLFAGDEDLICNYKGIERLIGDLTWNGEQGMTDTPAEKWYLNETYAGIWQTARNLTYVRVAGGSHMVGYDLPQVTSDMITRFMNVDMSLLPGEVAGVPSRLGEEERPYIGSLSGALTVPSKGKSEVDGWYAGSALLLLLLLCAAVGGYFYLRARNRFRKSRIALEPRPMQDEEERVPLGPGEVHELGDYPPSGSGNGYKGSGNGSVGEDYGDGDTQVVFELGDEDDNEHEQDNRRRDSQRG